MEKFSKVLKLENDIRNNNKYDKFIWCQLESRSGGDWNNYEVGDIISYDIDLLEQCDDEIDNFIDSWNWDLKDEDKVLLEDLKEYVGEGICYKGSYDDNDWYNVEFVGDVMVISFICGEEI